MPQLLSKVIKGSISELIIAPDAAMKEPELAALIAQAVSICSESDYYLGRTLIEMLGSQAAPAFAIYEALAWGYSKKQALRSAAAMVLEADDCQLFDAILKLYGQDENQRNKFAHWLWCYTGKAPGYVILLNPLEALRIKIIPHIKPRASRHIPAEQALELADAYCYSKHELEQIVERFTDTIGLIEMFRNHVHLSSASKGQMRDYLAIQPRMAEALRHLERPIQTLPAARPELPEK